ncbi:MAG: hypothetical protein HEQ13_26710 [Dolichospermum sp. DEX189]|nr:hypothetical protein [Dolichospermum sp. DEX189]
MSLWQGKRQKARVKRVWAILHFFTQFGFIVFTYLFINSEQMRISIRWESLNSIF